MINHRGKTSVLQSSEWFSRNGIECSRVIACDDGFPRHSHDEYVISANLSGIEEVWLSGKNLTAKSGQVTLYNPASVQSSKFAQQSVEFISIHLPQSVVKTLVAQENLGSRSQAPVLREGVLDDPQLFHAICRFAGSARKDNDSLQQQELLQLCGELLEPSVSLTGSEAQQISRVTDYLRCHLTEKPSLETLAQIAGLSKYHFVRLFTRYTGLPPLQYHMQLRLHQARNLLRRNTSPLEAAISLGFYDQSHFINAFRKVMGITPGHYIARLGLSRG